MSTTKHVPLPDSPEFTLVLQKWAALTGIDTNDPICITTAHIYGLYEILLASQGNVIGHLDKVDNRFHSVEQRLYGIEDSLNKMYQRLERIDEGLTGLDGKQIQAVSSKGENANTLKLFRSLSERLTALEKSNMSLEAHKKHIYLVMKGVVILSRRMDKLVGQAPITSSATDKTSTLDGAIELEASKLSGSIAGSGYKVQPRKAESFRRTKQFGRWCSLFLSDLDARTLINAIALILGFGLFGVGIGFGIQYAQSNRLFDKPAAAPTPSASSPVNKK